mmetsp:Transcript_43149/g.77564  ORF Transcript_43149/g.77564 Transcript_43149/m.77564 type:complete len:357 (+) Transcript_43149:738-1808(+)
MGTLLWKPRSNSGHLPQWICTTRRLPLQTLSFDPHLNVVFIPPEPYHICGHRLQLSDFLLRQLNGLGSKVLLEVCHFGRPWDRDDRHLQRAGLGKEPGKRQRGGRAAFAGSHGLDLPDDLVVFRQVLLGKPRQRGPPVGRGCIQFPTQLLPAQRRIRHEGNPQLHARRHDGVLQVTGEERPLLLHVPDGVDRVRLADLGRRGLGQAHLLDLARRHEALRCLHEVRHVMVCRQAVAVVHVDVVRAQAGQRRLQGLGHVLECGVAAVAEGHVLGGNRDVLPPRLLGKQAHHRLVPGLGALRGGEGVAGAVDLGGVEVGHPGGEHRLQHRDGIVLGEGRAVEGRQAHAAEALLGHCASQ